MMDTVKLYASGVTPNPGAGDLDAAGIPHGMRKSLDVALIVGFLAVDLFFFHDVFKNGESTSVPQYMTGALSLVVFAICTQSLLKSPR